MDLQIIPDPGDLKAVLKMFNPITEKFDDVQTGKFASIARDEDGVTEVASRQRDIWCYGKLVDETPLPPNSFIRDGRQGGGANNRRRSSLTHCRNLVPTGKSQILNNPNSFHAVHTCMCTRASLRFITLTITLRGGILLGDIFLTVVVLHRGA